jgi:nucleotide-binding universal stress UspA family protein
MQRIIVPTDFSEFAGFAARAAVAIAWQTGAELSFLHLLPAGVNPPRKSVGGRKNPAREAADNLQDMTDMAGKQGVKARSLLLEAEGYRHLVKAILEANGDLAIVGSQGKGSLSNSIPGSNTAKILRLCKVPVLVLQKELDPSALSGPFVFASGLEADTHAAFEKLLAFKGALSQAPLHLIEIATPNNFRPSSVVRKEMSDFLSHHECPGIQTHTYNHYNVEAGLLEFSREINASLIAISNHGRSDLSGLFIESIPENLIRFSDFPVLSIRV